MQEQDCVGKFVEFNINFADAASLASGTDTKDLFFNGDVWSVRCFPHGAAGDDGAGEYLSIHIQSKRIQRGGRLLFKAMVLGRGAGGAASASAAAAATAHPPSIHAAFQNVIEYPKHPVPLKLTKIFRTNELAEHCTVCGYVTVVCGVVLLRHSPIPVPPSSFNSELSGLDVQNRYGEPDMTVTFSDGKSVGVNRNVLAARCRVLKDALEHETAQQNTTIVEAKPEDGGGPMEDSSDSPDITTVVGGEEVTAIMTRTKRAEAPRHITVNAIPGLVAWTFYALLVYIYCDRLPRDKECCGKLVTVDRLRDLLAAADRFQLPRLKLMCAKKLWEDMSVETVSKTLWFAHEYNCNELKTACMDFITVAANSYHVMLTDGFHWLAHESPIIMNELKQRGTKTYL